ncbi:MAG: envelope stress response membrane protein PspB [Kangiellaceae bacterium]|jgi:phage shock protein B|nr:envelope stress response membrane protein PspB [Kangiellaceae bacterium]
MSEGFIFVLAILFMVVVVPTWLSFHYGEKKKQRKAEPVESAEDLGQLHQLASDLNERIGTLESILDAEAPNWRKQYDK